MAETTQSIGAKLTTVTPELAEQLLQRNTGNRKLEAARVKQYAADIERGDWALNGEAIKVSVSGRILDGQHRLMAVIEASKSIESILITGLADEAQETMDQGKARSLGDLLRMRGESNYSTLAAVVKTINVYQRHGSLVPVIGQPQPTTAQMLRTLERNEEIRESVDFALKNTRSWLQKSNVAALHYLFASVDQADADDFFTRLATGENLDSTNPIYVLRERLIKEKYEPEHIGPKAKLAFMVRTWNAYRRGETFKRLMWVAGGSNPDKFPVIDGLATAEGS